jgi:hypothetical protein
MKALRKTAAVRGPQCNEHCSKWPGWSFVCVSPIRCTKAVKICAFIIEQAEKYAWINFFRSVLRNDGNCWSEFYKYGKRRKGNMKIIPAIKDHNGTIIMDTTEKANILNSYYASVFCCDRNIPEIKLANSGKTFIINSKVIKKNREKQISRARWSSRWNSKTEWGSHDSLPS